MTWYGKTFFFIAHCFLHVFAYLLPRCIRFLWGFLCCCRCCETNEERRLNNFIFRPEKDLKVIHHYDRLEVLENVFGLFDVKQSRREDKQYCVEDYYLEEFENRRAMARATLTQGPHDQHPLHADGFNGAGSGFLGGNASAHERMLSASAATAAPTAEEQQHHHQLRSSLAGIGISDEDLPEYKQMKKDIEEEKKRLMKLKKEKMLTYTSPLYTGHIGTVMGAFRPSQEILYSRERFIAWDGCPLYVDWLYVEDEEPEAFMTAAYAAKVQKRRRKKGKNKSRKTASSASTTSTVNGGEGAKEHTVEMRNGMGEQEEQEDQMEGSYRLHNPRSGPGSAGTPTQRSASHPVQTSVGLHEEMVDVRLDGDDDHDNEEGEEVHEPYHSGTRTNPHHRSRANLDAVASLGKTSDPAPSHEYSPQENTTSGLNPPSRDKHDPHEDHSDERRGSKPGSDPGTNESSPPPTRKHTITSRQKAGGHFFSNLFGTSSSSLSSSLFSRNGSASAASAEEGKTNLTNATSDRPATNNGRTARGVVFILPGLASTSQSNYIQRLVRALHKHRYHVCVLNTRGMAADMEMGPHSNFLFSGGYTRDARDVVQNVLSRENVLRRFFPELFVPGASTAQGAMNYQVGLPVLGIGLSIGGAIMSKYLGEEGLSGRDPCLDAAITICPPNDFAKMVEHMNRGTYQKSVYQRDMCGDIKNYMLRHKQLQQMPNVDNDWVFSGVNGELLNFRDTVKDVSKAHEGKGKADREAQDRAREERDKKAAKMTMNIDNFSRVIHFDEHVIAKNAGYRSIHHYHYDTSAIKWLPYAPIPLLVLSTFDDPVIGRTVLGHRWREIINGNNYLTEHTRAKRMFNALNHNMSDFQHENIRNSNSSPNLNYYESVSPTTSVAAQNISRLTQTKAVDILQNTIQNNKNVVYCESHCGGHMGFLGGPIDELLEREDFMQRFVLQRFEAVTDFYFTHVLKTQEDKFKDNNRSVSEERDANGIHKCSPSVRKTFVEERHLSGIMRPPYALHELKRQHEREARMQNLADTIRKDIHEDVDGTAQQTPARTTPQGLSPSPGLALPLSIRSGDDSEDEKDLSAMSATNKPSFPVGEHDAKTCQNVGSRLPPRAVHDTTSEGKHPANNSLPSLSTSDGTNQQEKHSTHVDTDATAEYPTEASPYAQDHKSLGFHSVPPKPLSGPALSSAQHTKGWNNNRPNLSVAPILSQKPVPPPLWRKSNKCYFTYKTLRNTKRGSDFRTFYDSFFVEDTDADSSSRGTQGPYQDPSNPTATTTATNGNNGSGTQNGSALPHASSAECVVLSTDCEDQEPSVAYSGTNKRVSVEGIVGEHLRARQQQQAGGGGDAHADGFQEADGAVHVTFNLDNASDSADGELYEHPNMAAIRLRNEKNGNVTKPMSTDVLDLMTFTRMAVPPGRDYENLSFETHLQEGHVAKDGVSAEEAARLFHFKGYMLNWMDATGPYQPVRVNCDYTIDPRVYMREDL